MLGEPRCPNCGGYYHGTGACGTFTPWPAPRATSWNGPRCPTCNQGYIGQHECDPAVLDAFVEQLHRKAAELRAKAAV